MKVCVFGAGAVGGHLAVRSKLGGAETSVVARGRQLEAIETNGLTVLATGQEYHARVRASANPNDLGPQDAVIVTVKAPALRDIAQSIGPLLGPDTAVLFAMNGIPWWYFHEEGGPFEGTQLPSIDPNGALWKAIGPERALGAVVYSACSIVEPGVIRLAGARNRLELGEPSGTDSQRINAFAELLHAGGLEAIVTPNIRDAIWKKLLNNVASGILATLTQKTVDQIAAEQSCENVMRQMMDETIRVSVALGCEPGADTDSIMTFMKNLTHQPSILQDLEQGRPMEIEAIFGIILKLARMVDVETPTLDLMVTLARLRAESAGLLN